ncbi:hypothetical protein [Emergencia sp. 1XD21-10]|uniref:hypothetical protein n=1 Tax=Emergencia sp. 1XD21-10 TaxID=2304569 RepID=UPI00137A6E94|nr:hypothetical protein [Emergencia sp. 1XD21-10]NCE98198.1 hypothetical protein [Emergencia sp. 1XD21-10]
MGRKIKFTGYELAKPVFDACEANIKAYPYLINVRRSFSEINGLKRNFAERVLNKVDLDLRISEIEEAFLQIPEKYVAAVKYYLFSKEKKAVVESQIELTYLLDYGEVVTWANKLIYLYAELLGYPISKKGEEVNLWIDENGEVEIF